MGTAHRLRIDLEIDEAERLGETAQVALYTIIRELLEQAVRRGPPTRIEVKMSTTSDGGVQTCVSDDAEPERRRRSFEGVEERVKQLHGTIDLDRRERAHDGDGDAARVRDAALSDLRSAPMSDGNGYVLFVWSPAGYTLREMDGDLPEVGHRWDEDGLTLADQQDRRLPPPRRHAPLRVLRRGQLGASQAAASSAAASPSTSACARPLA